MASDFEELVVRVRDHYLEQFWQFIEEQKKSCSVGTNELKIQANGDTGAYRNLYCMDFATNENGKIGLVELAADRFLLFDPLTFDCGRATLLVDHLRWGDVVIEHDLPDVPADEIATWFDRWFGPDDQQTDMIHSLFLEPGEISIDMGTAPPGALYDMLELLEGAGARTLRITASVAEPEE
jgi:hypothetical protein